MDRRADFEAWTRSEAFRKAHAGAGSSKIMSAGPPRLELFGTEAGTLTG